MLEAKEIDAAKKDATKKTPTVKHQAKKNRSETVSTNRLQALLLSIFILSLFVLLNNLLLFQTSQNRSGAKMSREEVSLLDCIIFWFFEHILIACSSSEGCGQQCSGKQRSTI